MLWDYLLEYKSKRGEAELREVMGKVISQWHIFETLDLAIPEADIPGSLPPKIMLICLSFANKSLLAWSVCVCVCVWCSARLEIEMVELSQDPSSHPGALTLTLCPCWWGRGSPKWPPCSGVRKWWRSSLNQRCFHCWGPGSCLGPHWGSPSLDPETWLNWFAWRVARRCHCLSHTPGSVLGRWWAGWLFW